MEHVDHKPEKTYDAMKRDPRVAHWRRYNNDVEAGQAAPIKDTGSKDVASNPFHKGGQFDASRNFSRSEGVQSLRGDGGEPERPDSSRARQSSQEVQDRAARPVSLAILRAYEVRDILWSLTKNQAAAMRLKKLAKEKEGSWPHSTALTAT